MVGDVHGEFPTLENLLAHVGFAPERDRLFALGDLVDRGARSTDALAWMHSGRIALSVRGNHEQMLLERIEAAEGDLGERKPVMMHPWFTRDVERVGWTRWTAMICAMPIEATICTPAGSVGLVHATPTARHWNTMLAKLGAGDTDTMWTAINSTAYAVSTWVEDLASVGGPARDCPPPSPDGEPAPGVIPHAFGRDLLAHKRRLLAEDQVDQLLA